MILAELDPLTVAILPFAIVFTILACAVSYFLGTRRGFHKGRRAAYEDQLNSTIERARRHFNEHVSRFPFRRVRLTPLGRYQVTDERIVNQGWRPSR
jgi:hypothetical protein